MSIFRDRQKRSFSYSVDTFLVHKDEELIDHLNAWGGDGYQAINIENLGPGLMSTKKNQTTFIKFGLNMKKVLKNNIRPHKDH